MEEKSFTMEEISLTDESEKETQAPTVVFSLIHQKKSFMGVMNRSLMVMSGLYASKL